MMEASHLTILQVLSRLTMLPIVVAAGLALWRWRALPPSLRYLAALALLELPLELLGFWLMLRQQNNLFLMPIYTVGELGLLALVYRYTLQSAAFTRWVPWVVAGFAAYAGADSLLGPGLTWYRPGQQVVQSVLLLGFAGLYFNKLLSELSVKRLTHEPLFWVSLGVVVYFLGYLQIALFSNYLLRHYSPQFNRYIWSVHSLLTIVLHSCYCLALWIRPPK